VSRLDQLRRGFSEAWRLVKDPAGWSARWYRKKNNYDHAFATPEVWRDPREPLGSEESSDEFDKGKKETDTLD